MFLPGDTPGKSASIVLPFALFEKGGPWPGRTSRPVAGQDKPARGRARQAGPWSGKTSRPVAGQDKPPSCLRQGRGVAPRASRLLACRKGGGAPRASRFLAYGKSGSSVPAAGREHANMHGKPTLSARLAAGRSCPFSGLAAGEASPAPPGRGLRPLPTPLRGALPPRPPNGGKCPPYPPLKGRVRDRTGQAAFLRAARAEVPFLRLGGNTPICMENPHCPRAWRRGGVVRSRDSLRGRPPPLPPGGGCAPFQPL